MAERLEERLARLERERQEADRRYNEALTALDRSLQQRPDLPAPPTPYDASRLPEANTRWDVLTAAPPLDGPIKGRLRRFIWRVVGPALQAQRHFNATLVDHLNRNVAAHEQANQSLERLIGSVADHIDGQIRFQAHLLQLLQSVTAYVDTKDRSVAGGHEVLNAGLSAVTDDWLKRWESLSVRDERLARRMASLDDLRATTALAQQTALSLKREVERLLANTAGTGPASSPEPASSPVAGVDLNAFKYLGFEDQFRGSADDIRNRLREYVPLFEGQTDVLDIGCGRGEFLELLRERGIAARGVDVNHAMVQASRERGLQVELGDALGYLAGLPDNSLGGLFAAQVVEHLAPDYLGNLLETAAHKIRPGGLIVLETINPACWLAFFESYIRDLSHVRPLHPETLQYLLRVSGFGDVRLEYKSPVAEHSRLQPVYLPDAELPPPLVDLVQGLNENIEKLNGRLFTFQDYAAIGRR